MGYRDSGANTNPHQASNNSRADPKEHSGERQTGWTIRTQTGICSGSNTKDERERTSNPTRRYGDYSKVDSGSKPRHSQSYNGAHEGATPCTSPTGRLGATTSWRATPSSKGGELKSSRSESKYPLDSHIS